MDKKNKISKILLSEKKIKLKLLSYLKYEDQFNLFQTSKLFKKYFQKEEKEIKKKKFEIYLKKNDDYKKKKRVCKINYLKKNNSLQKFVLNSNFELIDSKKEKEMLKKKIPKKLQDESDYIHFYSSDLNKFLILRRVWIDKNLNIIKTKDTEEPSLKLNEVIEEINNKNGFNTNYFEKHKKLQKKLKSLKKNKLEKKKIQISDFFKIRKLSIIMFQGGDFSLVIYNNFKEKAHTSQHKYIIRKKGGGKKQSQKDRTKKVVSIGSQIRRENEKLLLLKMKESIQQYKDLLDECDLILFFAPGENMGVLINFFKECGLGTKKIRSLGMDVNKAKYNQVVNCYEKLTKIYIA